MPIFEYEDFQGNVKEVLVCGKPPPNLPGGFRRQAIARFAVNTKRPAPTMQEDVKRGYYRLEEKGGRWPSDFSKNKIKKAWNL